MSEGEVGKCRENRRKNVLTVGRQKKSMHRRPFQVQSQFSLVLETRAKRRQWAFNGDRSIFPPTTLFPRRFLLHLFFRRNSVYNCSPLGKLTVTGWEVSVQLGGPTPVTRFVGYTPHSPSSDAPSLLPASPAIDHLHNFATVSTCAIAYIESCRRTWDQSWLTLADGVNVLSNRCHGEFEIYWESKECRASWG